MINYFFYKDYMFNKMIKHSNPLFVSAIMISIIEFSNALLILLIINKYTLQLTNTFFSSFMFFITIGVISFIINTVYFKKNLERICNKYKGESQIKNILGYVLYVIYFIGSITLLLVLGENYGLYL